MMEQTFSNISNKLNCFSQYYDYNNSVSSEEIFVEDKNEIDISTSTNSTYEVFNDELDLLYQSITDKAIESMQELFDDYIDRLEINPEKFETEIDKLYESLIVSIDNFLRFIMLYDYSDLMSFHPEFDFDDDGELLLEWFGRIGARANITFGKNGEMYFVALFHGQTIKNKLFIDFQNVDYIKAIVSKIKADSY